MIRRWIDSIVAHIVKTMKEDDKCPDQPRYFDGNYCHTPDTHAIQTLKMWKDAGE
jgi:hypothetical protein